MLVNFGMVEPFKWEKAYVIPTGSTVLSQWEYLKQNRWQHLADIGHFTDEYWKSFEKNYVEPLAAIEVPGIAESGKLCTCHSSPFAYPANKEAPQVRHELLSLDDIFDIAKHTYALPMMSPMFKKRLGFVGKDVVPWWMRCACGNVMSAIKLERRDGVLATEVGLDALRRAPMKTFSRSFFPDATGRAVGNIVRSNIPKQEARWGIARFARLMGEYKGEIYFREWSSESIIRAYNQSDYRYETKSDAVVAILLQMACSQTFYDSYPSTSLLRVFKSPEALSRLFRMVSELSPSEYAHYKSLNKKDEWVARAKTGFGIIAQAAEQDVDVDLLASLRDG